MTSLISASMIAIIGNGLAGLTTALALAQRGKSVVIIAKPNDELAATPAAHGISTIKGILESDSELFALKLAGHRGFNTWLSGLENSLGQKRPQAAWVNSVVEIFQDFESFCREFGRIYRRDFFGAKRVTFDAFAADAFARVTYPGDFWISPEYLVDILKKCIEKKGIKTISSEVLRVSTELEGCQVTLADGHQFTARAAVLCAGARMPNLLSNSGIKEEDWFAVAGYTFKAQGEVSDACYVKGTSGLTAIDGGIFFGSTSEETIKIDSRREASIQVKKILDAVGELALAHKELAKLSLVFSPKEMSKLRATWGVRIRTRTRKPIIRRVGEKDNIWLNAGYYKSGIILSWLMAEELAEKICVGL